MQPVPHTDIPSSSAASALGPAHRLARQTQPQAGAHQSFHPAASSFAASAANTAAAMGSTLREASHVLRAPESQVLLDN